MTALVWLVPIALLMGIAGLGAFFWSLKSGQYDDMSGAAHRILLSDDEAADAPQPAGQSVAKKLSGAGRRGDG